MIEAIYKRRSIRYFQDKPIPEEVLTEILRAGRQAPSGRNRQPWKFIVVSGAAKAGMLAAMEEGIGESKDRLLDAAEEGVRFTMRAMSEAPVTIFVINTFGRNPRAHWTAAEKINELSNMQGIGAAAENMALTAADLGLGSLWIGHVFYAYDALMRWLHTDGQMALALSLGYSAQPEHLRTPPRKPLEDIVEYRS